MALTRKPVHQSRPSGTLAVTLYQPAAGVTDDLRIRIVRNSGVTGSATFNLYHDIDGTTFDADSEITPPLTLSDGDQYTEERVSADENGAIGFKTSVANALTITIWSLQES